jgi:hypothetical protein
MTSIRSASKPTAALLFAMLFLVAAGLFIEWDYLNEYPSHIHAWAEQDHYALSLGFQHNGFDFFHPETMIYNKQFPGWWKEAYDTTVTSAGFPIHEYFAALLMKLFGTTSPWVFRVWTLLWSFLGLGFLYKISYRLTSDGAKSLLVSSIALTSPVMAYYLNGFLPGVPALSLSIIGFWYYLKHLESRQRRDFHVSIAFLTLAMLIRTTFAIALITVLCFELWRILRKESTFLDKLSAVLISLCVYLACFLWNRHLTQQHGTLFLNQLLPPESWQDAKELLSDAYHNWRFHYFQRFHYGVFLMTILAAVAAALYRAFRKKSFSKMSPEKKTLSLWWLPLIQLFGCLLFTAAMMQQIQYHDYYFLDTFFLPLLLVLILLLKSIPTPTRKVLVGVEYLIALVLLVVMIHNASDMQVFRRQSENYAWNTHQNYQDADLLLDSLGIPADAKVLCLYGYAQNGPFLQMKRKGFIVMEDKDELLEAAFQFPFDCVVIENEKLDTYYINRASFFNGLKKFGGNEKISVFLPFYSTIESMKY